jgi:hypothetical protein
MKFYETSCKSLTDVDSRKKIKKKIPPDGRLKNGVGQLPIGITAAQASMYRP